MVGKHNFTLRKAQEKDIDQLVYLMNSQYLRKKSKDYFLWQYFNFSYPTVLMCAFINDDLIGMFGLQKRCLENGIKVGQAIDLLVETQWRGQGILKKLYQEILEYCNDIDILCAFTNFHGKQVTEKIIGGKTVSKIASLSLHTKDYQSDLDLGSLEKILQPDKIDYLHRFSYSPEIIYWRFESHPDYQYERILIHDDCWSIIKIFSEPLTNHKYGDIVAINYNYHNPNDLMDLLEKSILNLKDKQAETITLWGMPHTLLYKLSQCLKFQELEQERYFCLKVINQEYNYLYDISHWDLVQSDSEIY